MLDLKQIIIESATLDDLKAMCMIEHDAHMAPWTEAMLKSSLTGANLCWKLSVANQLSAYLVVMKALDELELLNIAVAPTSQGLGIGKLLVEHLILFSNNNQVKNIFLEVRQSNTPAIKLYQNAGFKQIATRKNYYSHKKGREDALVMQYTC